MMVTVKRTAMIVTVLLTLAVLFLKKSVMMM